MDDRRRDRGTQDVGPDREWGRSRGGDSASESSHQLKPADYRIYTLSTALGRAGACTEPESAFAADSITIVIEVIGIRTADINRSLRILWPVARSTRAVIIRGWRQAWRIARRAVIARLICGSTCILAAILLSFLTTLPLYLTLLLTLLTLRLAKLAPCLLPLFPHAPLCIAEFGGV
jgi:hypothetical protein